MFLTARASVPKRKSLLDSAGMCWAKSLMLFSTGFGFRGLAHTSPRFFAGTTANLRSEVARTEGFQRLTLISVD